MPRRPAPVIRGAPRSRPRPPSAAARGGAHVPRSRRRVFRRGAGPASSTTFSSPRIRRQNTSSAAEEATISAQPTIAIRLRGDGAPPTPGQEHRRNALGPNRYRGPGGANEAGEQAEMSEADHADPDAHGEHAEDAAAHLGRRGEVDKRRLHDAETGIGDARHQKNGAGEQRTGGQCEHRQHQKVDAHAPDIKAGEYRRLGQERDYDSAAKCADSVHAGEKSDAGGAKTQIILADYRDHAGERPAEGVVD